MAAEAAVILLASVKVGDMGITKAVRFDHQTTIKDALIHIAAKCSLAVPEEELCQHYTLYVPPKESAPAKYLWIMDSLLLSSATFDNRDEVEVRRMASSLMVLDPEGHETHQAKVDLEQTGAEYLTALCKIYNLAPSHHELCIRHSASDGEEFYSTQHGVIEAGRSLREQGVVEATVLMLRTTKRKKKKKLSMEAKSPHFVRASSRMEVGTRHSKTAIFGRPLKHALVAPTADAPQPRVAPLIVSAVTFVFEHGMEVTGIFRISAKSAQVDHLKNQLDDYTATPRFAGDEDPHLVCSILKQYLRDLPEPVVPFRFYHDFLDLYEAHPEDPVGIRDGMKALLPQIPEENLALLGFLCVFLQHVAEYEEHNKMGHRNLATVFGPNFLRLPAAGEDIQAMMRDAPRLTVLTSAMIIHAEELFGIPEELQQLCAARRARKKPQKLTVIGYAQAVYSYTAAGEAEIDLASGDLLIIFAQQASGWWVGCVHNSNQAGYLPSNYCTEMVDSLIEAKRLAQPGSSPSCVEEEEAPGDEQKVLEREVRRLKRKLEKQSKLARAEAEKRRQLEVYTLQQLERLSASMQVV